MVDWLLTLSQALKGGEGGGLRLVDQKAEERGRSESVFFFIFTSWLIGAFDSVFLCQLLV